MERLGSVALVVVVAALVSTGCGQETGEGNVVAAQGPDPATEISVQVPSESTTVRLQVVLPEGWEVNPDFGTLVYQPANRDDFADAPLLQIETAVEGEESPDVVPENVATYLEGVKDHLSKITTGDAALDALGANVEIVEETHGGGDWFLLLKVTYPDLVSATMYPPRYYLYRIVHTRGEPFFVRVSGTVPLAEADRFLGPVTTACKSTTRL